MYAFANSHGGVCLGKTCTGILKIQATTFFLILPTRSALKRGLWVEKSANIF